MTPPKFTGQPDCTVCKGKGSYEYREFDGYDRHYWYTAKCYDCYVQYLTKYGLGFGIRTFGWSSEDKVWTILEKYQDKRFYHYKLYDTLKPNIVRELTLTQLLNFHAGLSELLFKESRVDS